MVFVEFENVPLAPEPGAVNTTETPESPLFPASVTFTESGFANAVFTTALCGVPIPLTVTEEGGPNVTFSLNVWFSGGSVETAVTVNPPTVLPAVSAGAVEK